VLLFLFARFEPGLEGTGHWFFVGFELDVCLVLFCVSFCSPREINKGDEVAWYADGDNMVRNEYNLSIAYAFGECS
jgi:hypothetical protein